MDGLCVDYLFFKCDFFFVCCVLTKAAGSSSDTCHYDRSRHGIGAVSRIHSGKIRHEEQRYYDCGVVVVGCTCYHARLFYFYSLGKPVGETILFFGCRHKEEDFIYEEELQQYIDDGLLTVSDVEFSCSDVFFCVPFLFHWLVFRSTRPSLAVRPTRFM